MSRNSFTSDDYSVSSEIVENAIFCASLSHYPGETPLLTTKQNFYCHKIFLIGKYSTHLLCNRYTKPNNLQENTENTEKNKLFSRMEVKIFW